MGDQGDLREQMNRQTSFARSFFQSGPNHDALDEANDSNAAAFPMPRSRRSASRRSSRASSRASSTAAAASAAVAALDIKQRSSSNNDYDGKDEPTDLPGQDVKEKEPLQRANSWYVDALRQQGGTAENLTEILGENARGETSGAGASDGGWDDDEVLEQYRLMAQHEANLRVKENTGFDMAEYEKRRKLQGPEIQDKVGLYGGGKKPRQRLPEPKKISSSGSDLTLNKPMEPPLPPFVVNRRYIEQRCPRVPELCQGTPVRGGGASHTLSEDELAVRCLGCREQLRVKRLATLVSCPICNTVSPASATRR